VAENPNHWQQVQTPTGKLIARSDSEVLEQESWVCADPGHYGIYREASNCRICGEPRIKKVVPVGFAEKS